MEVGILALVGAPPPIPLCPNDSCTAPTNDTRAPHCNQLLIRNHWYSVLLKVIWHGVMWDESAVWYGLISCGTLWCGMVVCIRFGVVQCGMLWCGTVWHLLNREGSGAMQLCAHMTALWYSVVCHVMVCVVCSGVVHCDAGVV